MRRALIAATLFSLAAGFALAPPARAQMGGLLFGKAGTRKVSADVREVTARGNNMREKRSSLEMALRKAAKLAAKEKKPFIAVLREKSGSWLMNGRRIGDETTLRFKLLDREEPVLDDQGKPTRLFSVADLLTGDE
ncbi:MAG TPA: hypothetical protein VGB62_00185 [Allosphingosinicella sp.]|jgi:hypothetical protein